MDVAVKGDKMHRVLALFLCVISIICCYSFETFALENKLNLQLRLDASVLIIGFGIPFNNGDYLEIGYGYTSYRKERIYVPIIYSKQLRASEKDRTALNFGAILTHGEGEMYFAENGTFPELIIEEEWLIGENIYWSFNGGLPYILGLGLKWYI